MYQNNAYRGGNSNGYSGGYRSQNSNGQPAINEEPLTITNENYVDEAERRVNDLFSSGNMPTTNQIRNILARTAQLYDDIMSYTGDGLPERIELALKDIQVKLVYAAGRYPKVKSLVNKCALLANLGRVNDKASLIRYCRFMEAIVAYNKVNGNDNKEEK